MSTDKEYWFFEQSNRENICSAYWYKWKRLSASTQRYVNYVERYVHIVTWETLTQMSISGWKFSAHVVPLSCSGRYYLLFHEWNQKSPINGSKRNAKRIGETCCHGNGDILVHSKKAYNIKKRWGLRKNRRVSLDWQSVDLLSWMDWVSSCST